MSTWPNWRIRFLPSKAKGVVTPATASAPAMQMAMTAACFLFMCLFDVVLEGTASVRIAGRDGQAEAGDAIVVPAGAEFELANAHTAPLRLVCCLPVGGQGRPAAGHRGLEPVQVPFARFFASAAEDCAKHAKASGLRSQRIRKALGRATISDRRVCCVRGASCVWARRPADDH